MHWQFVIASYTTATVTLGLYTAWLLRRGRKLSQQLPEDKRRFLD